jgi:hypothetical protein
MLDMFYGNKKRICMEINQTDLMSFMYQIIIVVLFVYCLKMLVQWMGGSEKSPLTWVALGLVLYFAYQFLNMQ